MVFLLKIVVALLMVIAIGVGTYFGNIIGFLLTVGVAIILNGTFNRWEARRSASNK